VGIKPAIKAHNNKKNPVVRQDPKRLEADTNNLRDGLLGIVAGLEFIFPAAGFVAARLGLLLALCLAAFDLAGEPAPGIRGELQDRPGLVLGVPDQDPAAVAGGFDAATAVGSAAGALAPARACYWVHRSPPTVVSRSAVTSPETCVTVTGRAYADCENLAVQSL
jgi:hypothetical protein